VGFTGVVHISEMQSLVARIYAQPRLYSISSSHNATSGKLSLTVD
jgi:sulfite reductase alpha subunit-like flavoprotein